MNEQFLKLPEEKQMRIINAGFEVFGESGYKHASTDLIAARAGISKGLLFYYFHNKKSFYLYLLSYAEELTKNFIMDTHYREIRDFFELFEYSAQKKLVMSRRNPHIFDFAVRVFYSKDEAVLEEVSTIFTEKIESAYRDYFTNIDMSKFKPDADPVEIIHMMLYLSDGYMNECRRSGKTMDVEESMQKFRRWIRMLKQFSYREEYL